MGTLTTFNADNGTDGASCTPANLPATSVTVGGSGAITFSSSAAMTSGALGYRVVGQSSQRTYWEAPIASSKVQAFRGTLRLVIPSGGTKKPVEWRSGGNTLFALNVSGGNQLRVDDAAFVNVGPFLTVGVDYDVSLLAVVGASTTDGRATLKVYNKASGVQVGVTASVSAANFGSAAAA